MCKEGFDESLEKGPTRESALDDLLFYVTQRLSNFPFPNTPDMPALLLKKLVLSHTVAHIQYLTAVLNTLELYLRRSGANIEALSWLESGLGDVFAWGRRLSAYCEQTESALDSLGISPVVPSNCMTSVDNCDKDFQYVHRRMLNLKDRTRDLLSSVNGFMSVLEARRSLQEAKSVKMLTILGILFLPFAFTSGILSMGDNFAPGKSKFWVYWAVSGPFILLLFLIAILTRSFSFR